MATKKIAAKKASAKKAPAKKAAPRKTTAKKAAAKETSTKKVDNLEELPQPVSNRASTPHRDSVDKVQITVGPASSAPKMTTMEVAQMLEDGSKRWGTGRERDNALLDLGYDLEEIRLSQRDVRAKKAAKKG